jgi:hypothetical protein
VATDLQRRCGHHRTRTHDVDPDVSPLCFGARWSRMARADGLAWRAWLSSTTRCLTVDCLVPDRCSRASHQRVRCPEVLGLEIH